MISYLSKTQKKILSSHAHGGLSRRDFMAIGLKSFAASSVLGFLPRKFLFAQESLISQPAFIVIDLVGGAALPGNFLVGGKGGPHDLLPSYDTIGFNPRQSNIDDRFGLPAPRDISLFFQGLIETLSEEAQSLFRLSSIAHQAVDDSNNNTTSALGHVTHFWDKKLSSRPKGFGSEGTDSGGRTKLGFDEASLRPIQLTDVRQLNLLKGLGYLNNQGLSDQEIKDLLKFQETKAIEALEVLDDNKEHSLVTQFENHFKNLFHSMEQAMEIDPRLAPEARAIFGLNNNSQSTDVNVLAAGIIHAALAGLSGPSCIALGGYDYHDGTQTTGDRMDRLAGQTLGRTVELAHRMKKPLFVQILTDGSCAPQTGTRSWVSDSGQKTLTLMGYYNPKGVQQRKIQLGHFTQGQIAESETYVGRRTTNVAQAVFINYLASMGLEGEAEKFTDIDSKTLDTLLSFA